MSADIFTNATSTTVALSKTAPAPLTSESWAVGSTTGFPAASTGANPPTLFRIVDPAAPSEIMAVTNVSGTTWTVIRGYEGTTPVTHAAGFTVLNVVSAGYLGAVSMVRTTAAALATSANNIVATTIATFTVPANDAATGSWYQFNAFGTASSTGTPTITFRAKYGATGIATFTAITTASGLAGGGWQVAGNIYIITNGATGTISTFVRLDTQINSSTTDATQTLLSDGTFGSIDTTSAQSLTITAQWSAASASNTVSATFGAITRNC